MSLSLPNISELSPAKQELLRQRLLQQNQQRKPEPQDQIQRQPRDFSAGVSPSFPLSFAQERLWFLHQFEPESTAYNIPMTLSIQGMLNLAALEHSLNTVIQRHEILRTVFASHNDQPVQVILPKRSLPLEVIDLGHLNRLEQDIEVQHLAQQEAQQPFNLETGPLLRSTILRLNKTEQIALFTMHHSISDAWSMQVLIQEVIASYTAFITGKSATLPDLPIQYADFAVWQRQWLQENHLEAQLAYWQQQLSGTPSLLDLPTKQPRPALQTYRGATQSILLPPSFSQDLKTLARQEGATLFMVLLAAFKVLLYRYTQQEDLWIGTPIANRNRSQLEGLIGFFVNTQILRTQVKGTESFREFLSQVKRVALEAYAHQDLPFEQLVEALQPERDPSRNPLFDVMFILQNAPTQALDLPGLSLTPLKVETQTSNFDLTLATIESEQGLKAQLEYSTDLFNTDTIERLLQHFQALLAGIIAQPDQTLAHLPLLTSAEQQLLRDWNNTPRDYPPFRYIHELIEAQVKQIPDVVAVVFNDQALTYRELNDRANQVAHTLIQKGVGPEVRVGLCLERSVQAIVGVLGILKAGGAYVPLDPTYPVERLNFILTDADISLLLTQKDLLSSLPTDKAQVILVEDIEPAERQDNPQHRTAPDRLAYAIYTSGSTGQPKGVMIEHQSLINAYFGWQDAYQLKSQATTHLQMANFAFDVFTGDWVRALCSGGKLVLCPRETLLDPKALYTLMQQQQVNCAEFVPAVLRTLIEYLEQTQQTLGFMNLLICGSDRWTVQEYQTFRQYCGSQTRLINSFGLTEATIDSSYFEQTDLTLLPEQQVPIGKPFANTQLYILDTHLNPVPVGVKGELYIGGRGLARGYWNRPELTAERFIPNPFNPTSIARLYRTGDLARFLPDGNIEFLDRLDYQVKIRGVRIELGEIEAAIAQSPLVQQAIVTAHEANPSTVRLVAYVVLNSDTDCDHHTLSQTLRNHLAQSLTDCMIPSAFVILDAIPLTPNGKVDRRALPVPDKAELGLDRPFVAPQTALEQAIAAIWQQLLDIEAIGIHDNFFALGGHSLLATRVISKLRQELQSEIPLRCLFELPTISELAQYLEQSLSTQTPADLTASPIRTIPKRNTSSPCTLSFAQDRLYFLAQLEPNSPAYNIPCTLRIRGLLRVEILERCFAEIQRRHDILRTRFIQAHQQSVQVVEPSAIATLSLIELQHFPPTEQEAEIHRLAQKDSLEPFHLEQEPLLRIKLLRLDAADHILLLTIHHIISDAWSSDILTQELSALYEAFSIGNPSPLPELPIQYADFALWQRDWLQGDVLQTQLNYWSQQLKDAPPVLALPTDRPRPPIQSANGAIETVEFPPDLSKALQALAQQESVTLYMVLLAAFKILLYRYTGQTDILVGSAIANRNRPEIEGLIGFFVNTLVLRTQLSGHLNFRALLAQVRQVTLDAYEHQDLPFEKLVAELNIERNLSHQPLCQVAFELQNLAPRNPKIPGLHFEILEPDVHNAKYDLTLFMSETDRGLVGSCEYNTDLFDRETITCFLEHYRILLESILAHPDQKISTLPLLSHFERQQLFIEWNNPYGSYPKDQTVQQFFEVQVERTPNAIAAIDEDQCISYQELNRQANRIAHYLISLGVKADKLVGLCFERSINLIATLLGVLKAGGAYVPIDPTYPQDRIRDILEDARLQIVLTQTNLTHHFQQSVRPLCLDDSDLTQQCDRNPPPIPGNQHLSYLIYTSGSTGKPKGTMIEHRALANYTQAAIEHYGIRQADRILQFASISFDAAAEEIFPTLARGATLVLRTEEMLSTIPTFLNRCREQYITVLDLPTAFWHLLVTDMQRLNLTLPNSIRLVVIGGEAASAEHLATWQQLAPQVRLVNSYGPTETTIVATTCELSPQRIAPGNIVPIGKPIARGQTYVLDTALQPLPIGVPGELYIGGAGLARGYLHQPEQTAKAFIPHPFSPDPQARLYRTGDRVRYRRDSNLEFLGRLDEQVKIRGFRIELGEIEALLRQQSGVKTALVVAYEDHGTQSLAAYIVPDETLVPCIPPPDALPQSLVTPPLIRQLRSQIKVKLPSYMMPSTFICLDTLPLTPNGKVNRQALPRPESSRSDLEQTFIAPRNPLEEQMAQLWTEVLGLEQIGIHDNFFELGGHSLLTTQLILKVKETFQVELPLRILFEAPTIASLVENIQTPTTSSPIGEDTVNLKREATLEEDIRPKTPFIPSQYDPTSILLTGATGFLGAFLLYELLQQTQAKVYCLVRATSLEAGHQKLQDCLKAYLIWQDSFESRIIPILGDLALPRLGITDADYHTLSRQIDIIYHNGAWVHHIYPYSVLKPTNVLGTKEIIKLACETKTKPIHFISTPNVFSSTGCTGVRTVLENESIDCEKIPKDGYIQTKWVAEKLIQTAAQRGLPICIYRPARISGHSQTGVFNPNDFLYRLIIGCVQMGSVPEGNLNEDIIPIDYASQAIVYLSQQQSFGQAFHMVNPQLLEIDMLLSVLHSCGYLLPQIPYEQWRTTLVNLAEQSPEQALSALLPFFPPQTQHQNQPQTELKLDCQNTLAGLADSGITCPALDETLLRTYLSYLIQSQTLAPA